MRRWVWQLIGLLLLAGCSPHEEQSYPLNPSERVPRLKRVTVAPRFTPLRIPSQKQPLSLEAALRGALCPLDIRQRLEIVNVEYWGFDARAHKGQLVIHRDLASDVRSIFAELLQKRFPIQSIEPIVVYRWSDDDSMQENNTSGFNYRNVLGTERLSNHATGCAIDVNPKINPYFRNGASMPPNATYDVGRKGAITPVIAQVFERHGWRWGGTWREKDWQHFDKTVQGERKEGEHASLP